MRVLGATSRRGPVQAVRLLRSPSPASSAQRTSSASGGDEAAELVHTLTDGLGAHSVLECVGTGEPTPWRSPLSALAAPSAGSVSRTTRGIPSAQPSLYAKPSASAAVRPPARASTEEFLPDVLGVGSSLVASFSTAWSTSTRFRPRMSGANAGGAGPTGRGRRSPDLKLFTARCLRT